MEPFAALLLGQLGLVGNKIDEDKQKAKELNDAVNSKSTLNINDLAGPKLDKTKDKADDLTKTPLEMLLGANVDPARAETAQLVRWIESQGGKVDADGNIKPGKDATGRLLKWIAQQKKDIKVGADTNPAREAIRRLKASAGSIRLPIIGNLGRFLAEGGPVGRYATAGPIRGPGGPKSDKIPILASNGEHMLSAEEVDAMGGHSNVIAFRRSLRRADGGPVAQKAIPTLPNGPLDLSAATIDRLGRVIGREIAAATPRGGRSGDLATMIARGR
jgi:hypothetical protein